MQAMYVPLEIWTMIKEYAPVKNWARACSISRALHELRRWIVAAEVRSYLGNYEHIPTDQLQLEKWGDCHSLFINLRQLHEAGRLSSRQIEQMTDASCWLPDLHCLHIIGRDQQPLILDKQSIEGRLVELLARHVQVLTLQVAKLAMPLHMPSLQHLLLDLDTVPYTYGRSGARWSHDDIFPAISHLEGLRTLYVQSARKDAYIDKTSGSVGPERGLRDCVHLQHVVMQGIRLADDLSVPAGCSLQVICRPSCVSDFTRGCWPGFTRMILRHSSPLRLDPRTYSSTSELLPKLEYCALRCLRLALKRDQLSERHRRGKRLQLNFRSNWGPLEVLELDVECDLAVYIDSAHILESLVVFASGSLTFHASPLELEPSSPLWECSKLCEPSMTTLKRMYLRSGKRLSDAYWAALEVSWLRTTEMTFLDYVKEQQHGWTARVPADFQPSSLHECCCHACPECLARAGVPLLCSQAWTRDGFDKYLRPLCNKAP